MLWCRGSARQALELLDRLVCLADVHQADAHLEAAAGVGRESVGALAVEVQLARVDLLVQALANLLKLRLVGLAAKLLVGHRQVAAKRLDVQVHHFQRQVEVVPRRPQSFLEDLAGLFMLVRAPVRLGQVQVR